MFDCVVWSVSVCYHLPCRCLSVSFCIRISDFWQVQFPNVIAVSICLISFAKLNDTGSVGLLTLGRRVCIATCKRCWLTLCAKRICFTFHLLLCVHERETSSYSLLTSCISWRTMEATLETVCIYVSVCICVRVCMCVRVENWWFCILSFSPTAFCQIFNFFEWARQLQSIGRYVTEASLVVDERDELV